MGKALNAIALIVAGSCVACAQTSQAELVAKDRSICRGLPHGTGSDADFILAHETEDVIPLQSTGKSPGWIQGAALSIPPTSGRTAELLQRLVECRIAHLAAHPDAADAASPLAVPDVTVYVRSAGDRFNVELRSSHGAGSEILSRARALWARETATETLPATGMKPSSRLVNETHDQ